MALEADLGVDEGAPKGPLPAAPARCLDIVDLSKRFGGVYAVRGVTLRCGAGEILGLIGPNGAGKSTLINLITGTLRPDTGAVTMDGRSLVGLTVPQCARAGVGRTFQNIRLFAHLTVRQNVEVAHTTASRHRVGGPELHSIDDLLSRMGLAALAERMATTLPYGLQRRLEIARALALAPSYLLLDEPAAGMNDTESEQLVDLIQKIRDDFGCGVLVIEHDLRFIRRVCERVAVLHMGEILTIGGPEDVLNDPRVIDVYIGGGDEEEPT
ncbi:ABC transporter ATP-binding protein [Zavarzinia compransoris]|uniref:ABC transporter ATP-binding protein n=1 Tax=Zavarzinia marina TaxID=2911065 RepID=UPI001F294DC3|nr:ABC transporter ATP-binding protein [Zavarzinia marina]MCF4166751.1 ABC transporter ATP-binding protein [Zavarzinia marina]